MSQVWLDKIQMHQRFGAFPKSNFYAVEYTGPDAEAVLKYAEQSEEFAAWCKEAYLAMRAGTAPPPAPEFVNPSPKETKRSGTKTVQSKAQKG